VKPGYFNIKISNMALVMVLLVLATDALGGPIRYVLSRVGLEYLVYLPKLLGMLFVFREVFRRRINSVLFGFLMVLGVSAFVGALHQVSVKSLVFTIVIISPILFGISAAPYLLEKERALVTMLAVLFLVTALGVFIDIFIDFPWKGMSFKVDNKDIEGVRDWTTFGIERVAGFTRMSSQAAFYLASSSLFLFSYSRSTLLRILIVLTAFPLTVATTNKAGIVGFAIGLGACALNRWPRLQTAAIYSLIAAIFLFPVVSLLFTFNLDIRDPISLLLLASFEDRLINTWPLFFAGVAKYGSTLGGMGFGGVGSAAQYFAAGGREVFHYADNFALFLYGIFGVAVVPIFVYFGRVTTNLFRSPNRVIAALAPVMVSMLAESLTTDIIEAQVLALFLGIALTLHCCGRRVRLPEPAVPTLITGSQGGNI
jgi:hypothetical protein